MQRVKLLENVSAKKHTDGQADFVLEWSKSNTMHQTMQQYIVTLQSVCVWSLVCLSSTSTRQAVDAVGRIRVEKSRGFGQTADEVKHTWHNVRGSKLSHCQRCGAEKKFQKPTSRFAVPHVGDTPGTNVFAKSRVARLTAAFCQLEERGEKKPDVWKWGVNKTRTKSVRGRRGQTATAAACRGRQCLRRMRRVSLTSSCRRK